VKEARLVLLVTGNVKDLIPVREIENGCQEGTDWPATRLCKMEKDLRTGLETEWHPVPPGDREPVTIVDLYKLTKDVHRTCHLTLSNRSR
jgi:hypothetical protein